jgi:hypothetical protein
MGPLPSLLVQAVPVSEARMAAADEHASLASVGERAQVKLMPVDVFATAQRVQKVATVLLPALCECLDGIDESCGVPEVPPDEWVLRGVAVLCLES